MNPLVKKNIYRLSIPTCLVLLSLTGTSLAQTQSIEQEQLQKAQDRQKAIQEQQPQAARTQAPGLGWQAHRP